MKRFLFTLVTLCMMYSGNANATLPRFIDLYDGTVVDTVSKLRWLKNANCFGAQQWAIAVSSGAGLISGSCGLTDGSVLGDWHLPTIDELRIFVDAGYRTDTLNAAGFTGVQASFYWSSSSYASTTNLAWLVYMFSGDVVNDVKDIYGYVWPVRGGQFDYLASFGSLIIVQKSQLPQEIGLSDHRHAEFLIGNVGVADSNFLAQITGTNASEFSVAPGGASPCPSLSPTLGAGASCTLLVTATPTTKGAKAARVSITSSSIVTTTGSLNAPLTTTAITTNYGVVTDHSTGLPVSGATVTLSTSAVATTSTDGSYIFGNLPPATYSITVSKTGYQNVTVSNLSVTDTSSALANVWLPTTGFFNMLPQTATAANLTQGYSYRSRVTGGTYPYTFSLASGTLPGGITLDTTTGVLSGTPTLAGNYSFSIGVNDSATTAGYAEAPMTLNVAPPLIITTATLPAGEATRAYTTTLAKTGGDGTITFALSSGTLPTGLTLNTSTGVISGTPTSVGTANVSITVSDTFGRSYTKGYSLTIVSAFTVTTASPLPNATIGIPYSQTIATSGGVAPLRYRLSGGVLPTGLSLNATTGAISGTSSATGFINFGIEVSDSASPNQTTSKSFSIRTVPVSYTSYTLTSVFAGTGDGSVHSSPLTDINCIKGQTAGCSAAFATNSIVTLTATPNSSTSTFDSWSNACAAIPCNITMSGDKTAVATFNLAPRVKIALAASTGFDTLQLAYTSATTTIFALDGLFTGEWTLDDGGKNIVFTGGYLADYGATRGGFTVLGGKLTVKAGSLRVDGLKVR